MTLAAQSGSLERLKAAVDDESAEIRWRSTLPFLERAVELYGQGWTVNAIAVKLGIAWDSAAKLLDRAGVRAKRSRG